MSEESIAERIEREERERLENHPGLAELRRWREHKDEEERQEQQRREEEREKARREKSEREMAALKATTKERYINAGGPPLEFEEAWPSMKQEILKQRALEAEAEARRSAAAQYRAIF